MSVSELVPEHPRGSHQIDNVADEVARGQQYLHVALVSPERQIFEGEAHWVTLTGVDGQFGVWPRHAALVSALASGPLRIGLPEHEHLEFVTLGGFASIAENVVTILVDHAVTKDEIDVDAARRALEELEASSTEAVGEREATRRNNQRGYYRAQLKLAGQEA